MRTIAIDLDGSVPVYRQIADQLRSLAARGELPSDGVLPSVRQLSRKLGVNLNTVARAYRLLADEGQVEVRHGAPTRWVDRPDSVGRLSFAAGLDPETERRLFETFDRWVLQGADRDSVERLLKESVQRYYRARRKGA